MRTRLFSTALGLAAALAVALPFAARPVATFAAAAPAHHAQAEAMVEKQCLHSIREMYWIATGEDLGSYWDNWMVCV